MPFPASVLNVGSGAGEIFSCAGVDTDLFTAPDEQGRSYSTQWSSIYNLSEPSLMLCADRNAEQVYRYSP